MGHGTQKRVSTAARRENAEKQLRDLATPPDLGVAKLAKHKLMHELQVQQIELEMQNEELLAMHQEAERALDRYDFAPMGYYTLRPGSVIDEVNLGGAALLGRARTALIGTRLDAFVTLPCRPAFKQLLSVAFETGSKQICEITLLRSHKTPLVVTVVATRTPDGQHCRVAMLDVTDREQRSPAIDHVHPQSPQLDDAVRCAGYAVWQYDPNTQRLFWDERMFVIYGVPRFSFDGSAESWRCRVHPADREEANGRFARMLAGLDTPPFEFRIIRGSDGALRWVEASGAAQLDARGRIVRVIGLNRDISEQKAVEQSLRTAREHAETANRSKSAFLAEMGHEIRTPMTAILGYAELLARGVENRVTPEQQVEYLATILRNGKHLLEIVNDVLDVSRLDAGNMSSEQVQTSPKQLIDEVTDMLAVLASEKGITLGAAYGEAIPEAITTDPSKLRQILINLIGNAVKFTEKGGVTVRVAFASGDEPTMRVAIEDTGIGMSGEQLGLLFGAFSQASSATSRKYGGSGLGLHISRRLARLMGGDITVASKPGQGSVFTLTVPTTRYEVELAPTRLPSDSMRIGDHSVPGPPIVDIKPASKQRKSPGRSKKK